MPDNRAVRILVAEDDPDDRVLIEDAFEEAQLGNKIDFVENGEELISYLRREGPYAELKKEPMPGLVLLDLNMPRMDGREALRQVKSDERLRVVPIVALTTSRAAEDVHGCYGAGVNSYISKPDRFEDLVAIVRAIDDYWIKTVRLPPMCAAYDGG